MTTDPASLRAENARPDTDIVERRMYFDLDTRLPWRAAEGDAIHARLRRSVERRVTSYLWVPGDTPPFKPALLPIIFGDGRTLFTLSTINQRPRYWVIRGDSQWGCDLDGADTTGPEFGELTDDILTALEEAFGNGRCGYSGNSLFWPKRDRIKECKCEDCVEGPMARWPMVDGAGGCSWSRMDWPKGFRTVCNPASYRGNLLDEGEGMARAALAGKDEG